MTNYANIPAELRERKQWVVWKYITRKGESKPTKVPYNPVTYREAKSNDTATWGTFEQACTACVQHGYSGIGYMFSKDDPYSGVDFDTCMVDGAITSAAWAMIQALASYSEASPSKTGIHTIVRGRLPDGGRKSKEHGVEMYDQVRFFTFTGDHIGGTPRTIEDRQNELVALHTKIFGKALSAAEQAKQRPPTNIPDDDRELLDLMLAGFAGAKIQRLWDGDTTAHAGDDSAADLGLCNYLAFYTNGDRARIDRLFRQSKLMRPKWDREDYRKRTLDKAIKGTPNGYSGRGAKQQSMAQATPEIAQLPSAPVANIDLNGDMPEPPDYDSFFDRPHNTDMGNAQRMYAFAKDRVMYVPQFSKWYTWAGTHWQEDDNFAVLALAKQTVRHMYTELADIDEDDKRKEQLKWIIQSESRTRLESMIALLRSEPGISIHPDKLDQHAMLLPVKNGTIDLATGDLLKSDPTHRFTKCVDVEYDPSADCPLWEKFLIRIMGNNLELVSFIQRLVGHALTGDATGKYLVFMWGPKGNNGKSTLAETIMRLLGPYAMKSPTEMVMAKAYRGGVPNDIARLRGVRFTVTNEVDEGMTLSESVVKDLTGKDTLTARFMRAEFFDFEPTHKLWVYGNHKPEIRGTDPAIWDRVKLVPFEVEIPEKERDAHLLDKLAQELPGILAWAVRGCLAWRKVGINAPEIVKLATSEYRAEQDMFGQFIDDCCDLARTHEVGAGTVYQAYEAWCKVMGIKPETGTKFGSELGRRGYKSTRSANIRSRQGLRLNSYGQRLIGDSLPKHWTDDK